MEIQEFLKLLLRRKQTVISVVVVCLAVAMLLVVVQPFKYNSSSRLLVSQEFADGADAYTISQSNNHLSKLLSEVVGSGSFYNDVLDSGYNIDSNYFTHKRDKEEVMERWNKTVRASTPNTGNGIVNIEVFHPDRGQTEQIAQGVNYILRTKNQDYHSLGDGIFLKVIDRPIVSERPVEPNIFLIFPAAVLLAVFLAGSYIYFFPEDKYDIKIVSGNGRQTFSVNNIKSKKRGMIQELGGKIRQERSRDKQATEPSPSRDTDFSSKKAVDLDENKERQQEEEAKKRIPFTPDIPEPNKQGEQSNKREEVLPEELIEDTESFDRGKNKKDIEEKGDMSNIFG